MNTTKRAFAALLSLLLPLCAAATAFASDEYVDFDPQTATPNVSAPLFVIISYSAIWLLLLLFAVMIWRRQGRVAEEMQQLRARLARSNDQPATTGSGEAAGATR